MKAYKLWGQTLVAVRVVSKSGSLPITTQMPNGSRVPHAPISTGEVCAIVTCSSHTKRDTTSCTRLHTVCNRHPPVNDKYECGYLELTITTYRNMTVAV